MPADRRAPLPVTAVVLTFDAPDAALRCVRALAAQTRPPRELVLVDNHSAVPLDRATLQDAAGGIELHLLRMEENLGPAGGFARGLEAFLAGTGDYAWVMDDDVQPDPDCLEHYVAGVERVGAPVLGGAAVYDIESGERCDGWGWVGPLIPRRAVATLGVPRAELFWALEDQEYLRDRLPLGGYRPLRVDEAAVRIHRRADWRDPDRVQGMAFQWDKPDWKYYYEVRNFVFMYVWDRRHMPASVRMKSLANYLFMYSRCVVRERDDRGRKARCLARGLVDGLTRRLGRRMKPSRADRPFEV